MYVPVTLPVVLLAGPSNGNAARVNATGEVAVQALTVRAVCVGVVGTTAITAILENENM